jgi:hypothetical protein
LHSLFDVPVSLRPNFSGSSISKTHHPPAPVLGKSFALLIHFLGNTRSNTIRIAPVDCVLLRTLCYLATSNHSSSLYLASWPRPQLKSSLRLSSRTLSSLNSPRSRRQLSLSNQ